MATMLSLRGPTNILYYVDWSTGDLSQSGAVNLSSLCLSTNPNSAYITDSFNDGQKWIRFETRLADALCPAIGTAKRAEVSIFQASEAMASGEWFGWTTMYPAWQQFDVAPEVIGQYHHPALSPTGPPPFEIWAESNKYYMANTFDTLGNGVLYSKNTLIGTIVPGQKEQWVVYYHRALNMTGIIRAWRNGVKVFERYGSNANRYAGSIEPTGFFKIGMYKWVNGSLNTAVRSKHGSRVVYAGYLKVGDSGASLSDFYTAPTPPDTIPTTPPPVIDNKPRGKFRL